VCAAVGFGGRFRTTGFGAGGVSLVGSSVGFGPRGLSTSGFDGSGGLRGRSGSNASCGSRR
jgi:hypothetical protein